MPVKLVDRQWELLYGGPVKAREGAMGELYLDKSSFDDAKLLAALTEKRCVPILRAGIQLQVALSVKPDLPQHLRTCLLQSYASTHANIGHLGDFECSVSARVQDGSVSRLFAAYRGM